MKLFELLQEDDRSPLEEAADAVLDQCMPFVTQVSSEGISLWRGLRGQQNQGYVEKQPRSDRRPTDTHRFIHEIADQWFKQNFGVPLRSTSTFVMKNHIGADEFGTPHLIFPTGNQWKMYGSQKIEDLTYHMNTEIRDQLGDKLPGIGKKISATAMPPSQQQPELSDEEENLLESFIEDQLSQANYKQLTVQDIKQLSPTTEIMMLCNSYIAVRAHDATKFLELLNQRKQEQGSAR